MAQFTTRRNKYLDNNDEIFEVIMASPGPSVFVPKGNLNTGSDAFGRQRISQPYTVFDSSFRYTDSERRWNTKTSGSGSTSENANQSLIDLNLTTSSGDEIIRETDRVFSYQPGKSLLIMNTFTMNEAKTGLRQRVGYFGKQNGIFLELDGEDLYIVKRSFSTGSIVETRIHQSQWGVDKLDGSDTSRQVLDITQSQIFWMDVEWLGVGSIRCGFVINGQFILTHIFHHANNITGTYMTTASLPIRYEITNTAGTASNSTLKHICSTVISEGGYEQVGLTRSASNPLVGKNLTNDVNNPMVSIRLRSGRTDAVVVPREVSFYGLQATAFKYKIIRNATLTSPTWVTADSASGVEYDLTATAMSGGTTIFEGIFKGQATAPTLNLQTQFAANALQLTRQIIDADSAGDLLTIAIVPTTNNDDAIVALTWQERTA